MAEVLPSIITEPTSNSEPNECKDEEQQDEVSNKRKLAEEATSDENPEVPEKKVKSEESNEEPAEASKLEETENPIIEEEQAPPEPDKEPDKTDPSIQEPAETKDEPSSTSENKPEAKKKVQNLRKNIKEVIDDTQLDEATLAAQRQESERLARIQEQQKLIREQQRQIAVEKQQQKVLSLLQVDENEHVEPLSDDHDEGFDPFLKKFSLKGSDDIMEAAKATLESIKPLITTSDTEKSDDEEDDDDCIIQPISETGEKQKSAVVDLSSDSDDCIILSDEEEPEDLSDDDETNSGAHTNDIYNVRDGQGRVLINYMHGENEPDIFVAPQIARIIKPHQIGGVRFLYDNIIESTEIFDKSTGFGCILAQ